jgi:hypothetical protein
MVTASRKRLRILDKLARRVLGWGVSPVPNLSVFDKAWTAPLAGLGLGKTC